MTWCCVRCTQVKRYRSRCEVGPVGGCGAAETMAICEIWCWGKHMLLAETLVKAVKEVDRLLLMA